jgi:hypothetical protein
VNERYDAIDRHFLVVESPIRSEREVIDLDSPPPFGTLVSTGSLVTPVQASGTGNRLSRAARNLLKAQRLRAWSKHYFTSELEIGRAGHRNQEPRNFGRIRSNYFELAKKRKEEAALIYEQLKRNFVCVAAGWDSDTLLASLIDLDCVQNVAAAPAINAMPPAQLSAPPSSSSPINARLVETPSSVLTTCGEAVFSVNLGSAGNMSNNAWPTPVTSQQPLGSAHSRVQLGNRVDQRCNFTRPIQNFFNIGRINYDSSTSIGDFLTLVENADRNYPLNNDWMFEMTRKWLWATNLAPNLTWN